MALLVGTSGILISLLAFQDREFVLGGITLWMFAALVAVAIAPSDRDRRNAGGILLIVPAVSVYARLELEPNVCIFWMIAAVGSGAGFRMLMVGPRRSSAAALLLGVALICLMLGPKYLWEDFGFWWAGYRWSNWYNGTASEFVALGAGLSAAGLASAIVAFAILRRRRIRASG